MIAPAFLSRRGASDMDRETWLAERRNGITATEVVKLASYKTGAARARAMDVLASEKINGGSFEGNQYTEWGNDREPVLEEWAEFSFGFTPESRIAHAEQDRQHLASVDAWRVDPDGTLHLAELKTSGKRLTYDLCVEKGYVDQCLWQMYVTGAADALVLWEERLDNPDGPGFIPGVRGTILVERDQERINVLVGYATAFLLVLMDRLTGDDGSVNDPMLDDIVTQLQDAKATVAELDPKVRDMMESSGMTSAKTARWQVSYEASDPKPVPDLTAFAKAHPLEYKRLEEIADERTALHADEVAAIVALQASFTKMGAAPKPTLRITARKDAK